MAETFAQKLKRLRKGHGWTQDELANKVGIHGRHVGKYEIGRAMPSAETLVKLAEVLNVSIDYLLRDGTEPGSFLGLRDEELLRKFKALEQMPKEDKQVVISLIDAYIKKQQIETVLQQA